MKLKLLSFIFVLAATTAFAQSEEEFVIAAIEKATIVRFALVEVNGLGEYELRSEIGILEGKGATAAAKIAADPRSVSRLHLKCIPKFNVKIIFGNPRSSDAVEMLLCTGCRQTVAWLNRKHAREFDFTPEAQKKLLDALAPALPAIRAIPYEKEG